MTYKNDLMSNKHLISRSAVAGLAPAIVYLLMQATFRRGSEVGNITRGVFVAVLVAIVYFFVARRKEQRNP